MLTFDSIAPDAPPAALPARLEQTSRRGAILVAFAALCAAALTLALPFAILAHHLASEPSARSLAAEQPGTLLQLALGLVVWSILLGWPMARLAQRLAARRTVALQPGWIDVVECDLLGRRQWREPVTSYSGLAHHVRASLSGVRHELILVHPDPSRSVLIGLAPRFTDADIRRMTALLGVAEIPARALYNWPAPAAPAQFRSLQSQNA